MGFHRIFRNSRRINLSPLYFFGYFTHSMDNFHTAAVIDSHIEHHAVISGRVPLALCNAFPKAFGKDGRIAHNVDLHIVLHQLFQLRNQIIFKKLHQESYFQRRSFPVLRREGVESEHLDPHMSGSPYNGLHIGGTYLVPVSSLPASLSGPPAIAIQNDGHMFRKCLFIRHISFLVSGYKDLIAWTHLRCEG